MAFQIRVLAIRTLGETRRRRIFGKRIYGASIFGKAALLDFMVYILWYIILNDIDAVMKETSQNEENVLKDDKIESGST